MKLVQFRDGTYGVCKDSLFFTEFLSAQYTGFWYKENEDINLYCKFKKIEEAKEALEYYKKPEWVVIEDD